LFLYPSQLLQHAIELPRLNFLSTYRAVWPDSLADAALDACKQFVDSSERPGNGAEFRRRWRVWRTLQLLTQRRQHVTALPPPSMSVYASHAFKGSHQG
jgi:hypothetical protein